MTYLMDGASGIGFGSVMWGQGNLVTGSGHFSPLYQVMLSKIWEGVNFKTSLDQSVARGEWQDVDLFVSSDNLVLDRVYYKGS